MFTVTLRAAEILGLFLDEENIGVTDADTYREKLAALAPLLGLEGFDRREINQALAGQPPHGKLRGMKLTVQVVLYADDDTETVIREVLAVQREEPLAPDTLPSGRHRGVCPARVPGLRGPAPP